MGHNDHIDDDRPVLPAEAGTNDQSGFHPDDEWFGKADAKLRHEAMRAWFLSRYWDPANETPYDSEEGGYLYVYGGPFDADEELSDRFGHLATEDEIRAVVEDLESDGISDWAPIHTESDYDADFEFEANERSDPYEFFKQRLNEVDSLAATQVDPQRQPLLRQLLYSSLIAALEAYLADTMSYWVAVDKKILRRFVGSCEEFKLQKLNLSEIFERMDTLEDDVERHLQQLVWHRLDKVVPLLARSLDIERPSIGDLMKHIVIRHDIVHRGGKTKDGGVVIVTNEKLNELRGHVATFIDEIEAKLKERFPVIDHSRIDGVEEF